ncbi:hypothetical protein FRC12_000675 [Ceratobasidium sp. 428]|nr:hypothetical protein FRC12_000675 [Ceratobasidium sp. 428]
MSGENMPTPGPGFLGIIEEIIDLHGKGQRAKYVAIAGSTLLIYDWLLNLDLEVAYIWKRPWSVGRAVYHFNRVWPVIILGTVLPKTLFGMPSPTPAA